MIKLATTYKNKLVLIFCSLMLISLFLTQYKNTNPTSKNNLNSYSENIPWINAPALLSISMIGFILITILSNSTSELFKNFVYRKDLLIISITYVYLLSSFFYSDNYTYLFERLQIKLPFLMLPLVAASIKLNRRDIHILYFIFYVCTIVVAAYIFGNYVLNYENINEAYLRSKVMPTPINHIRFSIIAAFATYISYYLYIHKFSILKNNRWILIVGGVFLFLFVHLFSVRSGILALYGMILAEIVIYMIKTKSYSKGILALTGIIIFVTIVISVSPTLKNKISNTQNDLNVYKNKKSPNYSSLTTRFVSYEIAFEIFKKNKLFGCGLGDIDDKNNELFKEKYPVIDIPIIPHNEFIYLLAATGIVGVSIFTFCFFYPLFYKKNYLNRILLMHFIVLFLSFQTEPMIETQLGVAYSIIFIIIPLMEKKEDANS